VSNHVEDRDMSRWRIREAAVAAQKAARVMAAAWNFDTSTDGPEDR
jgi:hypothetical protein